MFGIDDAISGLFNIARDELQAAHTADNQEDAQQFNAEQAALSRAFNAQEAATARDWLGDQATTTRAFNSQEAQRARSYDHMMSNTAIQRRVQDLTAAGLNPLLAIQQGAAGHAGGGTASAGIPSGAHASAGMASSGIASPAPFLGVTAGLQSAAQIRLNDAATERTQAEAAKVRAEEEEIKARTPTHAQHIEVGKATVDSLRQGITESQQRIQKIIQETETSAATATNLAQQTQNLKELIPQIKANITALYAAAARDHAQVGLTKAQQEHLQQTIRQDMPALEAALRNLEIQSKKITQPTLEMEHSVTGHGYMGSLAATLKALNPFNNFLRSR